MSKEITFKSILMFVLTASFLAYEMGMQVSPGIITQDLMRDLHIDAYHLGIMSGVYFYTYTLMQIPAGLLYDRFMVRWVVVIPLLVCALGAYLFSISTNIWMASFARLCMGAGGAFAFIGVLVVAADVLPKRHFGIVVGLTQMLAAFGAMGGEVPLVYVVNRIGWRDTLSAIAMIGVVLAVLIWTFVRYQAVEACAHEAEEQKQESILTSMRRILGKKQTWFIALYACMLWAPMAGFASLWGVPYLQTVFKISHNEAADLAALMWVGIAIGSPLLGAWSDRIAQRKLPLAVAAIVGLIAFSCVYINPHWPMWMLSVFILCAGAACAGQALSFALVKEINSPQTLAAAIGFNNMAVVIAGAIFQPLMGKLIQWSHTTEVLDPSLYTTADFQRGFSTLVIAYAIGTFVSIFLIKDAPKKP
jgi:predicted MFS family arabinose efflux permease